MSDVAFEAHPLHSDIDHLRTIGQKRGFPNRLRRKIWLILLEDDCKEQAKERVETPHQDEKQVLLDTNRSFNTALPGTVDPAQTGGMKVELQYLVCDVLRRNPWLHYYQGYHDIAQLMYLVLGVSARPALERLSLVYLRDFMLSSLNPSMSMLRLVHQIVQVAEPEYAKALNDIEPYYAIPVLLTWWTHAMDTHEDACRMFDFLLSSDPVMILYTIAATTLLRKVETLECAGDQDMMFLVLSRGLQGLDLEELISFSLQLHNSIRPQQLPHWKRLSAHSCLKTFKDCEHGSTKSQHLAVKSQEHGITCQSIAKSHSTIQEVELEAEKARTIKSDKSSGTSKTTEVKRLGLLALGVGFLAVGLAWLVQHRDTT